MSFGSGGTGTSTGFSFGAQPSAGGGFSFGGAATTTAPAAQVPGAGSAFSFTPAAAATAPAAPPAASGFSFGGAGVAAGATSGFSFGQSAVGAPSTAAAAPAAVTATGFQVGGGAATAPTGFAFGPSGTATPASSAGAATLASSAATGGFGFGGATGAFSFSNPATTQNLTLGGGLMGASSLAGAGGASAAKLPFSFGGSTSSSGLTLGGAAAPTGTTAQVSAQTAAPSTSFGQKPLGSAQGTSVGPSGGLSLGGTPLASTAAAFPQGAPQLTTAAPSAGFSHGLGLAKTDTTSAPTSLAGTSGGFSLANASAAATASATAVAPSVASVANTTTVPSSSSSSSSSSFSFGAASASGTAAQQAGTVGAGLASFAGFKPPVTSAAAAAAAPATSTAGSAPAGAVTTSAAPSLTFSQLEELLNKWGSDLEEQEKHFLHQATQVNAWDRTLIENGDMITSLHKDVEKVKQDQKRLDQELDFILSQQRELGDLLLPLEESVKEQTGTIYMQHADEERQHTYKLAENIDAQLKRMAQDLKEIIEHLNTSSSSHNSTDPLQQICKILNAHMDSLQWIDQNTVFLQKKVEEVSKQFEAQRKEQEHPYRLGLN